MVPGLVGLHPVAPENLGEAFAHWATLPSTLVAVWPMVVFAMVAVFREWRHPTLHPFWYPAFALAALWTPFGSFWELDPSSLGLHLWAVPVLALCAALTFIPLTGRQSPRVPFMTWVTLCWAVFFLNDHLMAFLPAMAHGQWKGEGVREAVALQGGWWFEGIGGCGWKDSLVAMPVCAATFWMYARFVIPRFLWTSIPTRPVLPGPAG